MICLNWAVRPCRFFPHAFCEMDVCVCVYIVLTSSIGFSSYNNQTFIKLDHGIIFSCGAFARVHAIMCMRLICGSHARRVHEIQTWSSDEAHSNKKKINVIRFERAFLFGRSTCWLSKHTITLDIKRYCPGRRARTHWIPKGNKILVRARALHLFFSISGYALPGYASYGLISVSPGAVFLLFFSLSNRVIAVKKLLARETWVCSL